MSNAASTNFNYTYPGSLSLSIAVEPVVAADPLLDLLRVETGIRTGGKRFTKAGHPGKSVKAGGSCESWSADNGGIEFTDVLVQPKWLKARWEQCRHAFDETILEELLRLEPNMNIEGTAVGNVIYDIINTNIGREIVRLASFGDTGDANDFYNSMDGLWTKILAGTTYEVTTINGSMDSGDMTPAGIAALLNQHMNESDLLLRQLRPMDKVFLVTPNVFYQLRNYYSAIDPAAASGLNLQRLPIQYSILADGREALTFGGSAVIPMYSWEEWLIDPDNPLYGTVDTLILYTDPTNHILGTGNAGALGTVETYYDWKDETLLYRFIGTLDYQWFFDKLQSVSYGLTA